MKSGKPQAHGPHDSRGSPESRDAHGSTVRVPREGGATAPSGIVVRILDGKATPSSQRLTASGIRIGTSPRCEIVLEGNKTISRMHVELTPVPEGILVVDLGSSNGTFYMGQRVERVVLGAGSRFQVADVGVAIEPDDPSGLEPPIYPHESYRGMVGQSVPMRRLFALLARLEASTTPVLIDGESGVGKEEVARALHEGSLVATGPLVVVNCGAFARELVASELFGHKRGAFTGASEARQGAFEAADGGTLFLDEIGELPVDLQPHLLRALETGEIRPVGGDKAKKVSVRVLAATNRDLATEVRQGAFREDLYYRLAVVRLTVPPLRDRKDDVEPLARRFAERVGLAELPRPVLEALRTRDYPGNVRELRNVVQAYAALGVVPPPLAGGTKGRGSSLEEELRGSVDPNVPYAQQKDALVDKFTAAYLDVLLERTQGNQSLAAKLADLDRGYLGRLVARYGTPKGPRTK